MSLVERLLHQAWLRGNCGDTTLEEAADEIERLRLALFIAGIDPDAKPHPCDGDAPEERK